VIKYEVVVDASSATRCNCRICQKVNGLGAIVKPEAFTLLEGADRRTTYPNAIGARYFCSACGVHLYGTGNLPELGGEFVGVNVQTLDDLDPSEVAVMYWDGRHDNWHAGPRPQPWPIFSAA